MICDSHVHFFSPGFFDALGAHKGLPPENRGGEVAQALEWELAPSVAALAARWTSELDAHGVARAALIASVPGDEASVAAAVAAHAGARNVVITDVSEYRLELARKVGVGLAVNVADTSIETAQRHLGLREGFDVGLEMSGRPEALRDMITNMTHGGRIAVLGLPAEEFAVDFARIVTSMITIKGIYGREMFETWYAMSVLLERGLDINPVVTGRYPCQEFDAAFEDAAGGRCGKVVLDWTV